MVRTVKEILEQNRMKLEGVYLSLEMKTTRFPKTLWGGNFLEVPEEYHNYIVEESILLGENIETKRPIFTFYVKEKDEMYEEMQQLRKELEAYKATGLTPEKIYMLDRLYTEKCREVAGYQKQMPRCKIGDLGVEVFLSEDEARAALELKEGNRNGETEKEST